MDKVKMETCIQCKARWFDMKLKDGICHNCVLKDKGGQTLHLFSAENKMDPGIVPAHLLKKLCSLFSKDALHKSISYSPRTPPCMSRLKA
jgi:hypothetical protein